MQWNYPRDLPLSLPVFFFHVHPFLLYIYLRKASWVPKKCLIIRIHKQWLMHKQRPIYMQLILWGEGSWTGDDKLHDTLKTLLIYIPNLGMDSALWNSVCSLFAVSCPVRGSNCSEKKSLAGHTPDLVNEKTFIPKEAGHSFPCTGHLQWSSLFFYFILFFVVIFKIRKSNDTNVSECKKGFKIRLEVLHGLAKSSGVPVAATKSTNPFSSAPYSPVSH